MFKATEFTLSVLIFLCVTRGECEPLYLLSFAESEDSIYNPQTQLEQEDQSLTIAAELAVETINNKTDLLPGYTLQLVSRKSGCTVFDYVSLFRDLLYSNKRIAGIVGPGCYESSFALGYQIVQSNLSMISIGLHASSVQSEMVLKNSFSLLSAKDFSLALLKIIENSRWRQLFFVLDSTASYYSEIFDLVYNNLPGDVKRESSYRQLHNSTLRLNISVPDKTCIDNPRVFIVIAGSELTTEILCWFFQNQVLYPTYQFVIVGHTRDELLNSDQFETLCNDSIGVFQDGTIFLNYHFDETFSGTVSGLSYLKFIEEYNRHIEKQNSELNTTTGSLKPSFYGAFYFDAVWTQALALNAAIENGFNLSLYRYGDKNFTMKMRETLLSHSFFGISGEIRFNNSTQFVERIVDIYQIKNISMQKLEFYNSSTDEVHQYEINDSIHYIDSKFKISKPLDSTLGVVLLLLIALIALVIVVLQALTVVRRSYSSIKAMSPRLQHFSYTGCYMILFGCVLKVVCYCFDLPAVDNQCLVDHSAELFIGIGSVLLFVTLIAITYRIYRIFVHYINPGKFIQDSYLITFILFITIVYTVLNLIGYGQTLPKISLSCIDIKNEEMRVRFVCSYDEFHFRLTLLILPTILTMLACILALLSNSRISINRFKTAPVTILCYISLLNTVLWVIFHSTYAPAIPAFKVIVAVELVLVCSCIIFLYLPPIWPVFKEWHKGCLPSVVIQSNINQ